MLAIVGTDSELEEFQLALAKADGLPRRGTVVGGPDYLPTEYFPGAAGWTDRVADVVDTADGKRMLKVPAELVEHLGKTVSVDEKEVALPELSALVELPEPVKVEAEEVVAVELSDAVKEQGKALGEPKVRE